MKQSTIKTGEVLGENVTGVKFFKGDELEERGGKKIDITRPWFLLLDTEGVVTLAFHMIEHFGLNIMDILIHSKNVYWAAHCVLGHGKYSDEVDRQDLTSHRFQFSNVLYFWII